MAGISFRGRKNHEHINAGFHLWAGKELADISGYLVGDTVCIGFVGQLAKRKAIAKHAPLDSGFYCGDGDFLQVRCVVVKRHHSMIWRDVGKFEELTTGDIIMEGETGFWEDVLRWIVVNEQPEWIPDDWDSSS